jgi:L-ribulokinase
VLLGCTLSTRPEEVYRALIEATAFGTRLIIEAFTSQGARVDSLVAGGGLTRNELLMQIYADVAGQQIAVAANDQASAAGAAMLGATAAGSAGGGYGSLAEAASRMALPPARVFRPNPEHREPYAALYAEYRRLYDYFGRGQNLVMKALRRLRRS